MGLSVRRLALYVCGLTIGTVLYTMVYTSVALETLLAELVLQQEPIDFVVSWVNGTEPAQARLYASHRGSDHAQRWRDWGELRYCLRSIEMYAPWVRKVHLVVNNAARESLPDWLDTSSLRLRVVDARTLFSDPERQFPTANSNAIEVNLHRIAGLSRRFVYMNNDWFLRRPVLKSTFFVDAHNQWVFGSVLGVDGREQPPPSERGSREAALVRNARLLDNEFGYRPNRFGDLHAPLPIDGAVLAEMAERPTFREAFEQTAYNTFRGESDIVLAFFYNQYALETGRAWLHQPLLWGTVGSLQFGLRDSRWRNRAYMLLVALTNPTVICINDDVTDERAVPEIRRELGVFFETQWPRPSSFERHFTA